MSNKAASSIIYSIRTKLMALMLIFIAALMVTVLAFVNRSVGGIVLEENLDKGLAMARGVAAASDDPLLTNDDLTLFTVIKGVLDIRGVRYGIIVGTDNLIKAHSSVAKSGEAYHDPVGATVLKESGNARITHYNDPKLGGMYDISVPVRSARLREAIGYVHIGISRSVIDAAVANVKQSITYLTYAGLFIGGLGMIILTSLMVKPIRAISRGAKEIGEGNFDYRIEVNRKDEIGDLMHSFNEMAEGLKQKQFIKESFGRHVGNDIVEMILKNKETWFKGRKKTVTVMFADIRGFTAYSERKTPEQVINSLNEYFSLMTEIIHNNHGYVDKFIGDAIMAVFGSPVDYADHAVAAAAAACEMQEKLVTFNAKRPSAEHFEIGIGLNTGEVVAGNLGSVQRMEYAIIGDNVNIASRLCGAAKPNEIIISKVTFKGISGAAFAHKQLEAITVKGKSEPLEIYQIIQRRGPDRPDEKPKGVS